VLEGNSKGIGLDGERRDAGGDGVRRERRYGHCVMKGGRGCSRTTHSRPQQRRCANWRGERDVPQCGGWAEEGDGQHAEGEGEHISGAGDD